MRLELNAAMPVTRLGILARVARFGYLLLVWSGRRLLILRGKYGEGPCVLDNRLFVFEREPHLG